MSELGAQLLAVAAAHLPEPFRNAVHSEALQQLSPGLAAAARLGLECRLSSRDPRIDISQQLRRGDDGPRLLLDLAATRIPTSSNSQERALWIRIGDFARAWREDRPEMRAIREIWIEHDMPLPGAREAQLPSLFAGLTGHVLEQPQAARLFLEQVAPDLLGTWQRVEAALGALAGYSSQPGIVLGAMLSRAGELRTVIHIGKDSEVGGLLRHMEWPGDVSRVEELISALLARDLDVRLALGFDPAPMASCGVEIIFAAGERGISQRDWTLAWLAGQELADPGLAAAVGEWSGDIREADARAEWPAALVAGALFDTSVRDLVLSRFVNHLKLSLSGGQPVTSKAYLGLVLKRAS